MEEAGPHADATSPGSSSSSSYYPLLMIGGTVLIALVLSVYLLLRRGHNAGVRRRSGMRPAAGALRSSSSSSSESADNVTHGASEYESSAEEKSRLPRRRLVRGDGRVQHSEEIDLRNDARVSFERKLSSTPQRNPTFRGSTPAFGLRRGDGNGDGYGASGHGSRLSSSSSVTYASPSLYPNLSRASSSSSSYEQSPVRLPSSEVPLYRSATTAAAAAAAPPVGAQHPSVIPPLSSVPTQLRSIGAEELRSPGSAPPSPSSSTTGSSYPITFSSDGSTVSLQQGSSSPSRPDFMTPPVRISSNHHTGFGRPVTSPEAISPSMDIEVPNRNTANAENRKRLIIEEDDHDDDHGRACSSSNSLQWLEYRAAKDDASQTTGVQIKKQRITSPSSAVTSSPMEAVSRPKRRISPSKSGSPSDGQTAKRTKPAPPPVSGRVVKRKAHNASPERRVAAIVTTGEMPTNVQKRRRDLASVVTTQSDRPRFSPLPSRHYAGENELQPSNLLSHHPHRQQGLDEPKGDHAEYRPTDRDLFPTKPSDEKVTTLAEQSADAPRTPPRAPVSVLSPSVPSVTSIKSTPRHRVALTPRDKERAKGTNLSPLFGTLSDAKRSRPQSTVLSDEEDEDDEAAERRYKAISQSAQQKLEDKRKREEEDKKAKSTKPPRQISLSGILPPPPKPEPSPALSLSLSTPAAPVSVPPLTTAVSTPTTTSPTAPAPAVASTTPAAAAPATAPHQGQANALIMPPSQQQPAASSQPPSTVFFSAAAPSAAGQLPGYNAPQQTTGSGAGIGNAVTPSAIAAPLGSSASFMPPTTTASSSAASTSAGQTGVFTFGAPMMASSSTTSAPASTFGAGLSGSSSGGLGFSASSGSVPAFGASTAASTVHFGAAPSLAAPAPGTSSGQAGASTTAQFGIGGSSAAAAPSFGAGGPSPFGVPQPFSTSAGAFAPASTAPTPSSATSSTFGFGAPAATLSAPTQASAFAAPSAFGASSSSSSMSTSGSTAFGPTPSAFSGGPTSFSSSSSAFGSAPSSMSSFEAPRPFDSQAAPSSSAAFMASLGGGSAFGVPSSSAPGPFGAQAAPSSSAAFRAGAFGGPTPSTTPSASSSAAAAGGSILADTMAELQGGARKTLKARRKGGR